MKPETAPGQPTTSHATITTPTLTATSITGNSMPTATPEVDEDEYSIKPPMDSWDKNGSPQKSESHESLEAAVKSMLTFLYCRQFLFELGQRKRRRDRAKDSRGNQAAQQWHRSHLGFSRRVTCDRRESFIISHRCFIGKKTIFTSLHNFFFASSSFPLKASLAWRFVCRQE
jgi:hypothetical protein